MAEDPINGWLRALVDRHTAAMTRPEFLKAIRALSVRYVERRADLPRRSALDSAGKRAAFAAFYAPLHFLTTRRIVRALGGPRPDLETVLDLGCGTGVAGAAWAYDRAPRPLLRGVDISAWAVDEARWNWRALGLEGRATRGDLVATLESLCHGRRGSKDRKTDPTSTGLILGWSLNELEAASRDRALDCLLHLGGQGAPIIVIEPIAGRVAPWWNGWADRASHAGGRAEAWRFDDPLPPLLAELDDAAGFDREALTARSVAFNAGGPAAPGAVAGGTKRR